MAGSDQSFGKKEREKKKAKKRKEKELRKQQRKERANEGNKDEFVYVDKYGNLTNTPPDLTGKEEIDADDIVLGIPKKDKSNAEAPSFGQTGKVSFFDHSKGFGFIIDDNTSEKFFVHISGTIDEIQENDAVSFELERGQRGMNAVRVKKV